MFQDISWRSIETSFMRIFDVQLKFIKFGLSPQLLEKRISKIFSDLLQVNFFTFEQF